MKLNFEKIYNIGDVVKYNKKHSTICAITADNYVGTFSDGWLGMTNSYNILEGELDPEKKYHYMKNSDITPIPKKLPDKKMDNELEDYKEPLRKFKVGDRVRYDIHEGYDTIIAAVMVEVDRYIVEYKKGWSGDGNSYPLLSGYLESFGKYHYAYDDRLKLLPATVAKPYTLYKIGDKVMFNNLQTTIAAITTSGNYIVFHPVEGRGWRGNKNGHPLSEGTLDPDKTYWNVTERDIITAASTPITIKEHYDLKKGDPLPASLLNAWVMKGSNYYGDGWKNLSCITFMGDRRVLEIGEKDGVIAALVSGTCNVWIRVEGYNEFSYGYSDAEPSSSPEPCLIKSSKTKDDKVIKVYEVETDLVNKHKKVIYF